MSSTWLCSLTLRESFRIGMRQDKHTFPRLYNSETITWNCAQIEYFHLSSPFFVLPLLFQDQALLRSRTHLEMSLFLARRFWSKTHWGISLNLPPTPPLHPQFLLEGFTSFGIFSLKISGLKIILDYKGDSTIEWGCCTEICNSILSKLKPFLFSSAVMQQSTHSV